ncbi:uncharacterized protein LOC141692605 isoform X2 [Apium graveolens]|uniref:uncharacterized protein LOC141692605 isoform X2 n=1 Tax=Apium graveolens TaxID=4045 RepID=UPI003D78D9EE
MADLYDGKLWLPSYTFPANELTATQLPASMFSYYSTGPHSSTECFADTNLLPSNILHRPYNTHFNRPAVQSGSVLQGGAFGVNRVSAFEAFHMSNQFLTPVQLQVEMLRREERMLRNLAAQNLGIPRGGLGYEEQKKLIRGEYRGKGTGVFIPRTGIKAPTTRTRKDCARTKQEDQVHSHINSVKRFDTKNEVECHYHLPPELALPQDWTY